MACVRSFHSIALVLVFACLFAVSGAFAAEQNQTKDVTIFAAASLTGALGDITKNYDAAHPDVNITSNYDSSGTLQKQIEQGAPADLFLPAATSNIDALAKENLVDNKSAIKYATNELALIVPKDNPANIKGLADLAKKDIKIVIGGKDVPVGKYTQQMLNNTAKDTSLGADFVKAFKANVVSEETNVAGVVTKVGLGEADAGIAYKSDVTKDLAEKVTIIPIDTKYNVIAVYDAVVLNDSKQKETADDIAKFLTTADSQKILTDYGFKAAAA